MQGSGPAAPFEKVLPDRDFDVSASAPPLQGKLVP